MGGGASKEQKKPDAPAGASKKDIVDIVVPKKEDINPYPAGTLCVFFGSQTGTAEIFARSFTEEAKNKGFDAKVCDLEDFTYESMLAEEVANAVFLMATYGEGDPTDNAMQFFNWLKNDEGKLGNDTLSHLFFSVFGLGNKQYENFNKMGKETDRLLGMIGGKRLMALGLGDDDGTLEEDYEAWKKEVFAKLVMKFHPDPASLGLTNTGRLTESTGRAEKERMETVPLQFQTVMVPVADRNKAKPEIPVPSLIQTSTKHFFTAPTAKVVVSKELRKAHIEGVGSTIHLEFDIGGTGVSYETADNCAILPENSASSVERLANVLKYDLDDVFRIEKRASEKEAFPTPCSIRDALTKYYDISGYLRHSVVSQLYPYVQDDEQRIWLDNLLAKDNRSGFKEFMESNCVSLVDLLTDQLSSAVIPLVDFLHIVPFIQPRFYTISSSASLYPSTIHITIGLMQRLTANKKTSMGLCSQFCKDLIGGKSTCKFFVRPSSFRLPRNVSTPIFMIGPGTGLAPMRALLQERELQRDRLLKGLAIKFPASPSAKSHVKTDIKSPNREEVFSADVVGGSNTLYFGCKSKKLDYIYEEELSGYVDRKVLENLHLAFSRDQPHKVYVQHLMLEDKNAEALAEGLLTKDAYVFVCGATSMGTDVLEALKTILTTYGAGGSKPMSAADAATYVRELQESGRYVQELWSV